MMLVSENTSEPVTNVYIFCVVMVGCSALVLASIVLRGWRASNSVMMGNLSQPGHLLLPVCELSRID